MEKKYGFLSLIKGFITGISLLIPGISGAAIIFSLNSYDDFISGIGNYKESKDKFKLVVIPILIGIIIGIAAGAKLIAFLLTKYKLQTIMLFVGLMIGGIKTFYDRSKMKIDIKNILIFLLTVLVFIIGNYFISNKIAFNNMIIKTIVLSLIFGLSLIIPGINTNKFMSLTSASNIIIFIIAALLFIYIISKIVCYLKNKYQMKTSIIMIGLVFSSIIINILNINHIAFTFSYIFTSILSFLWGYILALNIVNE